MQEIKGELIMANTNISVDAVWDGGITGNGSLKANHLDTTIAIPTLFRGSGNGADPKDILVASITSCYIATLAFMLESRQLPVEKLTISSRTCISDDEFKIIHYPHVVLTADTTEQIRSVHRAIETADEGCSIGKLLKRAGVKIDVQGNVSVK